MDAEPAPWMRITGNEEIEETIVSHVLNVQPDPSNAV